MSTLKRMISVCAVALSALGLTSTVAKADFPEKPITMVVGFSAGGGMDTLARIAAEAASGPLGQAIAVENRPGAGGTIAPAHVAQQRADGYTLYIGETAALVGPVVFGDSVGYDPLTSFVPVAQLAVAPLALIANPDVHADDIAEFIDLVRENPGKYFYAASGVATLQHMSMEQLKAAADLDIEAVQFQGGAPSVQAVIAGEVSFAVTSLSAANRQAEGGAVKILGVTTLNPVPGFENLPTVSSVIPGFESVPRQFVMAPAGTPDDALAKLEAAFEAALASDSVQQQLLDRGLIPTYLSSAELAADLPGVTETWSATARDALSN